MIIYYKDSFKKQNIKALFRKKVIKDFTSVAGLNLAQQPIHMIRSFFVAKYLGPVEYGILSSIQLITLLNKYGNLGFNNTAAREVGNALGAKDYKKSERIKETAFSAEICLSLLLFVTGLISSIFFESTTISILIILASAGLLFAKLRAILATEAAINKRFILISKITFYTSIIGNIIIIITVPYLKIYAVMLTNSMISLLAIIFFRRFLKFKFKFHINKRELIQILKISVPLTIGTLSQGSFKYAERILILSYLGTISLGFFSFGTVIVSNVSMILKAGIKVRIQDIYEGLGEKKYKKIHHMVIRESLILSLISILAIPVFWILLEIFIPIFLDKWTNGLGAAQRYLFMMPFEIILLYPGTVLTSSLVNKQNIIPFFRFGITGLLILIVLTLHSFEILSIDRFIYINIGCIAIYNLIVLILYKKFFYNVYIKDNSKIEPDN